MAKIKNLRRSLTMHFAVIAWLTAMLVATGSGSYFLPIFIFLVSLAAFIFVDTLEWFEVGRLGSYLLMTIATGISLFFYIYSAFYTASEAGQLLAVAGLLVYPEGVLFLQRKSLRLYEQLAVFLLLEMIVAALVNDNIVFGVLLAPIMLMWVSSLFLFARYATLVHLDPSIERPMPHLAELLYERFRKSVIRSAPAPQLVQSKFVTPRNVQASRFGRRILQSLPIGAGSLVFAACFFCLMPRTSPASLRQPLRTDAARGLPKSLTLGEVGKLKQDPSPVMRVSLRHAESGRNYHMLEAPYFRARIMDAYVNSRNPSFIKRGQWSMTGTLLHRRLPPFDSALSFKSSGRDLVHVKFDIRRRYLPTLYALPATFASRPEQRLSLRYDRYGMLMQDVDPVYAPSGKSIVYEIGSADFAGGRQLPIVPVDVGGSDRERTYAYLNYQQLRVGFPRLVQTADYWRKLLSAEGISTADAYRAARLLEAHFIESGEFKYSLDLTLPDDPSVDPVEDFVVNKRVGHCQYFASALLIMMRQMGIPGRLVIGYHPYEFNSHGEYFAVKQRDAHAWVEAMFTREQLLGTDVEQWLTDSEDYWVRFDPTPAPEGTEESIIEQRGQTLDYAEKLWTDYVVDAQQLSGENSIYAPVAANSKSAYESFLKQFDAVRNGLDSQGLRSVGFAWPLTILIIVVGGMTILGWRMLLLLPRFAPRLAKKLGVGAPQKLVQEEFFARCLKLLRRAGFERINSETPREFTRQTSAALQPAGAASGAGLSHSLDLLTNQYYLRRFGDGHDLVPQEEAEILEALQLVESIVRGREAHGTRFRG